MTYQDSDKEFFQEKLRATLNFEPAPEQWDAITAPIGPGVIVAGAGTGKTTVMGLRIAWLVLTGQVDPDKILGLTFTNKAAAELKASVQSSIHAAKNIAATIKASNRPAGEDSDSDSGKKEESENSLWKMLANCCMRMVLTARMDAILRNGSIFFSSWVFLA